MGPFIFFSIAILSLFVTLVLFVFFIVTKKGGKVGNQIMAALLILMGLQIFYSYSISAYAFSYFMNLHKLLFMIRQTALLTGPSIYLYYQSFSKTVRIKPVHLLHIIPFAGALLLLGLFYHKIDHFVIWESKLGLYDTILILVQNLIYFLLILFNLKPFSHSLIGIFRNLKNSSLNGWLQFILLGFIILWIINLNIFATYMILKKPTWCAYTGSIYALTFFLFLNSIMFILLLKPEIYFLIEKYKKSRVNENVKSNYIQVLNDYMITRKPYLEPDVTIDVVAKDLSVSIRLLSQIINESYNNNFNSYMNEFRIKESLRQLSDNRNKKTILEILFDSGFNSKSVFYAEFKKHTGLTPQEYRAKCYSLEMIN